MMNYYQNRLKELKNEGAYRQLRTIETQGRYVATEGCKYLNLSSNDYLGLSGRSGFLQEFCEGLEHDTSFWAGSTSSRLLTGNFCEMQLLEDLLASLYQSEAALLFNSGYHANLGILPALAGKNDLILADKLVHASLIDGMRLSQARCFRFRHNHPEHLERLLHQHRDNYERVFIVTESVFSMEGDVADLPALCNLKEKYNALLYVDEAHAFGLLGTNGLGLCEQQECTHRIDMIVGTFGKAIASQGAFLICNQTLREYLINTMRPLIFSTAIAPVNIRWTLFVMNRILQLQPEKDRLAKLSAYFRNELEQMGFQPKGCSHIVPLIVGQNNRCIELSDKLRGSGFWALPVRYPTVPQGEARIRFSLRPDITDTEIEKLLKTLLSCR